MKRNSETEYLYFTALTEDRLLTLQVGDYVYEQGKYEWLPRQVESIDLQEKKIDFNTGYMVLTDYYYNFYVSTGFESP